MTSHPTHRQEHHHPRSRWILLITTAGALVGLIGWVRFGAPRSVPDIATEASGAAVGETTADSRVESQEPTGDAPEPAVDNRTTERIPPSETPSAGEPTAEEAQKLMDRLVSVMELLGKTGEPIAAETAASWKSGLRELAALGKTGIPGILQFFAEGRDVAFGQELRAELGHASARTGLIGVLRQIGGAESISAMSRILDVTPSYQELALLAQGLEETDPGQHREQALAAARAQLAAANSGSATAPGTDIAPLFEVLGSYGHAETAQDLESAAGRWKYYAMSALGRLPEGAGVPSLIRLAEPNSPGGHRLQALQVLTELAPTQEAARDFLISQASSGGIPSEYWSYLKQPLAGNQYFVADAILTQYPPVSNWAEIQTIHIQAGNQTLYSIPSAASQTPEGIQRQLSLIDQLTGFAQSPAAQSNLRQARQILELRMQRATAGQPAFSTENP